MKKKKKKKSRVKKFILFILFFAFLIFISFLLCAYVFEVKARSIVVHGNKIIKDSVVISLGFGDDNYPNFFLVNESKIKNKLKDNDLILDAEVKKSIFFEIHIYLKENKPLFFRTDTNKVVFASGEESALVDDLELNIPTLINYVPDTKYKKLIDKFNLIDSEIINKISDIKYDPNKYDEDRFLLYMNDSNRVYINLPKFKQLNKYDKMVKKFEGKSGTLFLDSGNYFKVDKKEK